METLVLTYEVLDDLHFAAFSLQIKLVVAHLNREPQLAFIPRVIVTVFVIKKNKGLAPVALSNLGYVVLNLSGLAVRARFRQ